MTSERDNKRREAIMNSGKELPGDAARADHEMNEDYDSPDTGNFRAQNIDGRRANQENRQEVNENASQLPGDQQRAKHDRAVDAQGPDAELSGDIPARGASRGPNDKFVTGGQATGGGTPVGGGSQVSEIGVSETMTGTSDETKMAQRAFGGSTTGYGRRDMETEGTTTGAPQSSGQTSSGISGSSDTGMVAGGGTEGSVSLTDEEEIARIAADRKRAEEARRNG